jgi:hypothetical protein
LLSNLPVGAKVKFGKFQVNTETPEPIVWTIVAKNHQCEPAYPESSVTLHATEILDLRCFDAKEPSNSNSNRKNYGNNRYSVSNLDQWLNKDAAGGAWYSAAHSADQSPDTTAGTGGYGTQYAARPGFLNGFTDDEKAAILSTTIRVVKPSVDGDSYEDVVRKVFLPSTTEVGLSNENSIAEGAAWGYYTSNTARIGYVTQQCFSNTPSSSKPSSKNTAWYWWLRTPRYSYSESARRVLSNGSLDYSRVYLGINGVRPALNLSSSLLVYDSTDADGCYTFKWNETPVDPDPPTPSGDSVTIHGTTYENVKAIHYVKNGATKALKKLVLNGSVIWQDDSARIVEGTQTSITIASDDTIVGYSALTVDDNDEIQGDSTSYSGTWSSNYATYQSTYPYIKHSTTVDTLAGTLESTASGAKYAFTMGTDGYYTSGNAGVNSSYSYGKLTFNFASETVVTLSCISYGESNYDYGIISNLNTALADSATIDTSNVFHSFKGESSADVKTYTVTVPAGSHYITFKYYKDSSQHQNGDYFKIRPTYAKPVSSWYKIVSATSSSATVLPLSVGN